MKRLILILVITLAAVGCGGSDGGSDGSTVVDIREPGPQLTASEYGDQGNAICDLMNVELDRLSSEFSSELSPEEQRDLSVEANTVSLSAIDDLFALTPPASLAAQRQSLLDIAQERRELIVRMNDGDDVADQFVQLNVDFEVEASAIWPSCTSG